MFIFFVVRPKSIGIVEIFFHDVSNRFILSIRMNIRLFVVQLRVVISREYFIQFFLFRVVIVIFFFTFFDGFIFIHNPNFFMMI